jgi:predicted permease
MHWLKQLFARRKMYDDLAEEIRQHLEEKIESLVSSGISRTEAEQRARREFGNVAVIAEEGREVWQWHTIESILGDLKFAMRQLRRAPGFAVVAVLTLALGIGASTAVFSLFDEVILHPLPYSEAERLVFVTETVPQLGSDEVGVSVQEALDYLARSQSFGQFATYQQSGFNLTGNDRPMRVNAAQISSQVFPVLQVRPALGRAFTAEDEKAGAEHVAIISWSLWHNLYLGDPNILGKLVKLNEVPYTVVGVMPPSFQFPFDGNPLSERADLWVPQVFAPIFLQPDNRIMEFGIGLVGRLKPGTTVEQARAGIQQIAQAFQHEHREVYSGNVGVEPHTYVFGGYTQRKARPLVILLVGAVLCVLLITCVNVANLLLARANHRGREMAIRAAIGAKRMRLLRQCLIESLLLAAAGAAVGILFAQAILVALRAWGPASIPRLHDASLNPGTLAFALGISVLTAVLFGFVPAWKLSQVSPQGALSEVRQVGAARAGQRLQDALAISEVALAVVLLIGGGLLVRSFMQLLNTPFGFDSKGVFLVRTLFDRGRYPDPNHRRAVQQEMLVQLSKLPGVEQVAAASHLPLADERQIGFRVQSDGPNEFHWAANSLVSPNYFRAMGIQLLAGRDFNEQDRRDATPVVVVSEAFVRQYAHGADPLGQRVEWGDRGPMTIVGVVSDVHVAALDADPPAMIYMSMFQIQSGGSDRTALVIHGAGERMVSFGEVQRVVWSLDSSLPLYDTTSLESLVAESLAQRRFTILLLGSFAFCAVLLAMIGLFGVLSYLVGRREREIGVRMALGANRRMILSMVLWRGLLLGVLGCALGLMLSMIVTNLWQASLYHVSRFDPLTLIGVPCLALLVAGIAVLLPAIRAASIEPMQALRAE